MESNESRDVVLGYFESLASGDQKAIWDAWAEDGTCWYGGDLPISGAWYGRDRVVNGFLATALSHLDPDRAHGVEVTNVFAERHQVLVEWDSWGTGRTGRAYDQKNAAIVIVRDGKLVGMREYADTQHWERALLPGEESRRAG